MFLGFLLFGSLGFWIVTFAALITITCAVEYERAGWATLTLIATLTALACFGDVNVLQFIHHNPLAAACCSVAYLAAGIVWALIKWKNYTTRLASRFEEEKRQWLRRVDVRVKNENYTPMVHNSREYIYTSRTVPEAGPVTIPDDLMTQWKIYAVHLIPTFSKSLGLITSWAAYWPVSLMWSLLRDWVLRVFESTVRRMKGVFVAVRNRAYADILKDLPADFKLDD